ncbi:MAG: response regulator [Treponema sp.]|jgi:two-component system response regulator YesN|nr:response regulator [Treponema sp.]
MYKIIVVEDEPAAAQNILDIIRLHCPRFEVTACADNGEAGLRLAARQQPDLLLTDIRMPGMDGLELITRLHEEFPRVKTMIVSGYQDFEYARTALKHGAADYLLKPVSPSALASSLERIIPLLEETAWRQKAVLLQRLLENGSGGPSPSLVEELKNSFTSPAYRAALSRKNGLPGRFHRSLYQDMKYAVDERSVVMYGRDEMENLRVTDASVCGGPDGEPAETPPWLYGDIPGYTTTAAWRRPFPIEDLPRIFTLLCGSLDRSLIIGKDLFTAANEESCARQRKNSGPDFETRHILGHYLNGNKTGAVRDLLLDSLKKWEAEGRTQLFVEESARLFFEQIRVETGNVPREDDFELMMDDAFFFAADYGDLRDSLLFILDKTIPGKDSPISKIDTPEFFTLIREYIAAHLAKPLNLQSLCRHFGISQTYLSRLFRKYTNQSFLSYLTRARIEQAKKYLAEKNTLVKDAAALTGFNDQFYFSRVFRSLTGLSPSEYRGPLETPVGVPEVPG